MKLIKYIPILFMLMSFSIKAQNKEVKTITIKVSGVCGMCEERIENALDVPGIKSANWNKENHLCEISYRTDKISEEEIHKLLNEAGHDTEKSTATDEQYSKVHDCCKYREHEDHD